MARRKSYPGHIEKRPNSYRVHLSIDGQRQKYTVKGDRKDAEKFAREKYAELERLVLRHSTLPGAVPISLVLRQFEVDSLPMLAPGTRLSYQDSLKPIRTFFLDVRDDPDIGDIRAAHIHDFLQWRRLHGPHGGRLRKPLANRTLAKDRAVLHRIFALADRLEIREGNPVSRVEPPKSDPRMPFILSDEEYEKLLESCEGRPMLRMYALLLGETGARCESEALHLRWEDVDIEEGFLWIASGRDGHRTKSGKGRWVPLTPRLRDALRDHSADYRLITYRGKRTPWVFHHTRRRRGAQPGQRIGSLRCAFRSACDRAKLPRTFVQHDLRHRRVTKWLAEQKSPALVKEAVGHSDLRTTMSYMHLAREHLRVLVDGSATEGRESMV